MNDLSKYGSWEKLDEFTDSSSDISSEEMNDPQEICLEPSTPPTIQDDFMEEGEVQEDQGYETPSTTRGLSVSHGEVNPQSSPDIVENHMYAEKRQDYHNNMFYTKTEFEYHYMDDGAHWEFQDPRNILRRQYIHDIIYYNPHLSKRRLDILIDKMIAYAC